MIKSFYFEFSNKFKISNEYEAITKDLGSENYCILKHIRKEIKFKKDVTGKFLDLWFDITLLDNTKFEVHKKLKNCITQIIENKLKH